MGLEKTGSPESSQPASFACEAIRVWAGEAGVKLNTSPVRQAASGDKEGAACREVGPRVLPFTGAIVPLPSATETEAALWPQLF